MPPNFTPEDWAEVKELFGVCLELSPDERAQALANAPVTEPVRQEAARLVRNHENAGAGFLAGAEAGEDNQSATTLVPSMIGRRLGPYEVLSLLGAGGMGEVYLARDHELKRDVALKVLPAAVADDAARLSRFKREAEILASLNHPGIASIHGIVENALVLELVEGEALPCPVSVELALAYMRQIVAAVEYAHERGVIHRDLKPANIKVTPDGTVKILDFGLATALDEKATLQQSPPDSPTPGSQDLSSGVIFGTAAYIAPEQAMGKTADRRSDIFSLGAIFYELLTGKRPFSRETLGETLAAVVNDEPDWTLLPAVPDYVRKLLKRMLTKDRKQRLQAIGEARILLDAPPQEAAAVPDRRWIRVLGGGVTAMVAAMTLFFAYRVPNPPPVVLQLNLDLGGMSFAPSTAGSVIVSPDGTRIASVHGTIESGMVTIVRRVDSLEDSAPLRIPDAFHPFFSPDGQSIGFFRRGTMWKMSVEGGAPTAISAAKVPRGASWADDGSIVAALDRVGGLSRITSGGGVRALTAVEPGESSHRWPQVLPGSKAVLFTIAGPGGPDANKIAVYSLRDQQQKILWKGGTFARYLPTGHLVFAYRDVLYAAPFDLKNLALTGDPHPVLNKVAIAPSGDNAYYGISDSGVLAYLGPSQIEPVDKVVHLGESGTGRILLPAPPERAVLSPDGRRVAFADLRAPGMWVNDLASGARVRLRAGAENLASTVALPLGWSPDGRFVYFVTRDANRDGISVMRADGSGQETNILTQRVQLQPNRSTISHDGRWLLFVDAPSNAQRDLWVQELDLSSPTPRKAGEPKPWLATGANEVDPVFSPDDRWVAYTSDDSGKNEVYVRPSQGTEGKWQISSGGGRRPLWARNGDLLYLGADGAVMKVPWRTMGPVFHAESPKEWSSTRVTQMYDITPDGKEVLAVTRDPQLGAAHVQATVIVNFFEALKQKMAAK